MATRSNTGRSAAVGAKSAGRRARKRPKAAARLTARDLGQLRKLLLQKRRQLVGAVGDLTAEAADGGSGGGSASYSASSDDPAESGWFCQRSDITAGLLANEQTILRDIEDALMRIAAGTYGRCEATGKPIGKARLMARPWARYCIEHARRLEQRRAVGNGAKLRRDPYRPPREQTVEVEPEPDDELPELPVPLNLDLDEPDEDACEKEGES